jgi:uncharacterized protein YmfQ (DUF2313 family)
MALFQISGSQTWVWQGQPAVADVTDTDKAGLVLRQFPFGRYFDRRNGWLPKVARAWARFLSRLVERRATMVRNMDPRTADELLDEWEQAYFDEPLDPSLTDDDRRQAILAQVRSRGGVTAAYYESVAADFGYPGAVVTDAADPFTTISPCDDFLAGGEWKVTFLVTVPSQTAVRDQQLERLINGQLLAGWFALYDFT